MPATGKDKKDFAFVTVRGGISGTGPARPENHRARLVDVWDVFFASGQVHYFCHAGVADLTMADHVTSQNPYGSHCQQLDTMFSTS